MAYEELGPVFIWRTIGTSKMALDVLASVTAEYLQNVGRTIRFLCDKYGN